MGLLAGLGGGWLDTVYRPRLIFGRLPARDQVAEVLVNESMAERDGLTVGDSIVLRSFVGGNFVQSVTVVGIHRGIIDLALQDTGPEILATFSFGAFWGDRFYPVLAASSELGLVRPVVVALVAGGPAEATAIVDDINNRRPDADASAQDTEGLLQATCRSRTTSSGHRFRQRSTSRIARRTRTLTELYRERSRSDVSGTLDALM